MKWLPLLKIPLTQGTENWCYTKNWEKLNFINFQKKLNVMYNWALMHGLVIIECVLCWDMDLKKVARFLWVSLLLVVVFNFALNFFNLSITPKPNSLGKNWYSNYKHKRFTINPIKFDFFFPLSTAIHPFLPTYIYIWSQCQFLSQYTLSLSIYIYKHIHICTHQI